MVHTFEPFENTLIDRAWIEENRRLTRRGVNVGSGHNVGVLGTCRTVTQYLPESDVQI